MYWVSNVKLCSVELGKDLNMASGATVLQVVQKTRVILRTSSVCGVSITTHFGTSISSAGNTTEFGYFDHLHSPDF